MKLKPFDLEAAKAGAQVVTRDGKPVRILCFDRKGNYPVVSLVQVGNEEAFVHSYVSGKFWKDGHYHEWDLFMAPVKRTVYINVFKDKLGYTVSELHDDSEEAHVAAEEGIEDGCHYYHIAMPVEIED